LDVSASEIGRPGAIAASHCETPSTPEEEIFERITRAACRVLDVPMAVISLIDGHRHWYTSRHGGALAEPPQQHAMCHHVVRNRAPLIVPDTAADARFRDDPLVTGEPHIRSFAGLPLQTRQGHSIGILCAWDTRPREFAFHQLDILTELAGMVTDALDLRRFATIDGLTGARVRPAFNDEARRALLLAQQHRTDVSFLLFEVDNFETLREAQGRAASDTLLADVLDTCRKAVPETAIFGRLTDQTFACMLPFTDGAAASQAAELMRRAIEGSAFGKAHALVRVTASVGVVASSQSTMELQYLLRQGTESLSAAKAAGGGRCVGARAASAEPVGIGRRMLKAGRIVINSGLMTYDCTVRRLSDAAATLEVHSGILLPKTFELHMGAGEFVKSCKVTRREERRLEVAFG